VNLLLDTHVLIWWIENSRRLGRQSKAIIQDDRTTIWISAAGRQQEIHAERDRKLEAARKQRLRRQQAA
jgi:PIN domain nuclease of toxin-antitoxin system